MFVSFILCIIACVYDVPAQTGRTALHYTARQGYVSTMRTLVNEFHLDPNVADKVSITLCYTYVCVYVAMCVIFVHSWVHVCSTRYMICTIAL